MPPTLAANPPSQPADSHQIIGRVVDRATADLAASEQFIARVLLRAHQTAETHNEPDEARAIFHVAVSFASELEERTPGFDRVGFIKAATGL